MGHEDGPDKDRKPVAQPGARPVPRISSRELMRQHSELIIEHDGREYRLRITQSGKLILTA
jgi:hemin uptake protein HemP